MAQNGLGCLAWGQVDGDTRETRTCRALLYVLVAHPNDMENMLVDMIVNTSKLHSLVGKSVENLCNNQNYAQVFLALIDFRLVDKQKGAIPCARANAGKRAASGEGACKLLGRRSEQLAVWFGNTRVQGVALVALYEGTRF